MTETSEYDVFLSFKNVDESGRPTRDRQLALELFNFLSHRGLHVFFSEVTLERQGVSAYKQVIDDSLDASRTLIAVGTSRAYLESRWVRYEWDSFFNDILSGVKPDGRVFVYVDGVPFNQLPRALRQAQCIQHSPDAMETLYRFISNASSLGKTLAYSRSETPTRSTQKEAYSSSEQPTGSAGITAQLLDGSVINYLNSERPIRGATKDVYFTPDHTMALKFYRTPDSNRVEPLRLLVERYNPTIPTKAGGMGGTDHSSAYFRKHFSWPSAVIVEPSQGVVVPTFPANFLFNTGPFRGKEKQASWFAVEKLEGRLPLDERGELIDRVRVCISLARCVRRLHQAGLAHSDLSGRNVLLDFRSGAALISDVESVVVPGLLPPDVLGTVGYVAPELIETIDKPLTNPGKRLPNIRTDEHALAVLIYQLLFKRHPLIGPKIHSTVSVEDDEFLAMGREALFIEDPTDNSNAPDSIKVPYTALGSHIEELCRQAFVEGLHNPERRPTAWEWERELVGFFDLLYPCPNAQCSGKWLLLNPTTLIGAPCPFCGVLIDEFIPRLEITRFSQDTSRSSVLRLPLFSGLGIYDWHLQDIYPGEDADHTRRAHIKRVHGELFLYTEGLHCQRLLTKDDEELSVDPIKLEDSALFRFTYGDTEAKVKVQIEKTETIEA